VALTVMVVAGFGRRESGVGVEDEVGAEDKGRSPESWRGELSSVQRVGRGLTVTVALLAIAAGRLGSTDELDNLAPALVVGAAWPLLVLASLAWAPAWRWLDPWDGSARALAAPEGEAGAVRPAAVTALGWVWYLCAYPHSLHPRAVATALALYSIVTVGGCLVVGRAAWLGRAEIFGLLFSWAARVRHGSLISWQPPRGAEVVLGVLAGGLLFGALKQTAVWGPLSVSPDAALYGVVGVMSCATLGGLGLWALSRWEEHLGARGGVAAASVVSVCSIALALAMARNRVFTSVQLLPALAGDPFGFGWNLLGEAGVGIDPAPLGITGRLVAQASVLVVGHAAGSALIAHRTAAPRRLPAFVALAALQVASLLTLTQV
jgi:hypothetical protein